MADINKTNQGKVLSEDSFEVRKLMHIGSFISDAPQVFIGTYSKYNRGMALGGEWVDLTTFSDYEEFMDFIRELHSDESDPEFMALDYANFPSSWYSESLISEKTFGKIQEYWNLDENEREAFDYFVDFVNEDSFERFHEMWEGDWDSREDFAEHVAGELYPDELNGVLGEYFDYHKFAQHLFEDGYLYKDGHVFNTNV